jgi:transcriptional regulator with XRE-family HTH domain
MLVYARRIQYLCAIMRAITDIKQARKDRKLSQEGAAKGLNCTRERISAIETGHGKLSIDELQDYGRALQLNICLLTDAEVEILHQLSVFCGKNGVK